MHCKVNPQRTTVSLPFVMDPWKTTQSKTFSKHMVRLWLILLLYSGPQRDRNGVQYIFRGDLLFYLFGGLYTWLCQWLCCSSVSSPPRIWLTHSNIPGGARDPLLKGDRSATVLSRLPSVTPLSVWSYDPLLFLLVIVTRGLPVEQLRPFRLTSPSHSQRIPTVEVKRIQPKNRKDHTRLTA